jgi:preprotein translocase subunit SecD
MLYFAPWKTTVVTLVILIGLLFTLPNFVPESVRLDANGEPKGVFTVLPHKTINLGLDLRGGSHLVFQGGYGRSAPGAAGEPARRCTQRAA